MLYKFSLNNSRTARARQSAKYLIITLNIQQFYYTNRCIGKRCAGKPPLELFLLATDRIPGVSGYEKINREPT